MLCGYLLPQHTLHTPRDLFVFLIHGIHVPSFKSSHDVHMSSLSPLCFILFESKHHKGLVFSVEAVTNRCRLTVGN